MDPPQAISQFCYLFPLHWSLLTSLGLALPVPPQATCKVQTHGKSHHFWKTPVVSHLLVLATSPLFVWLVILHSPAQNVNRPVQNSASNSKTGESRSLSARSKGGELDLISESCGVFWVLFCFVLAAPCSWRDLSSPTRDWTWATAVKAPSPNQWTTREFPVSCCFFF